MSGTPEAVREAAFRLFATQGYDATSVEEIVTAAGVSRSTFFRMFGSKEAVIFPDHDSLLALVDGRLRASDQASAIAAVSDAVRLVLFHYVAEGKRARDRYRLTSTVPALRERELISSARYQQLFRRFISEVDDSYHGQKLRAELVAAAIVAAHNSVLRRWLREECVSPQVEIDQALNAVYRLFEPVPNGDPIVLVVSADTSAAEIAARVSTWAIEMQSG